MTKAGTIIGVVAFLPLFAALSEEALNPYAAIILRNPFGLRPPPLPPETAGPALPQPLRELTLTGIADFSLKKWALLVASERGQPPKSYTLREGEEVDGLEVLAIDVLAGTVHVRLDHTQLTLSFKEQDQKQFLARAQEKRFVDEHTRAHELREKREAERRARERGELTSQTL